MRKHNKILLMIGSIIFMTISCQKSERKIVNDFRDIIADKVEKRVKDLAEPQGKGILINIPNPSNDEYMKESSILDSVSYIQLSNNKNAIVGEINKVELKKDVIYILDRYKTKTLKKFSKTGEFICQIGENGEGPEGYIEPTDFSIADNEIIIYDQFKHRMTFYSLNGQFKRSKKVPFIALKFHRFSPNQYMFYTVDQDNDHLQSIVNYSVFDSDSSYILRNRGFFRPKNMYRSLFVEDNFSKNGDKVYIHPPFSDTIFSVSQSDKINVEYVLDFGRRKLPQAITLTQKNKEFRAASDNNYYMIFPGHYVVLDDFLYFEFTKRNEAYRCVYSKNTGLISMGNCIIVDIAYIFPIQNILTGFSNVLVGYIHPSDIIKSLEKMDRKQRIKKIGEKYTRIADGLKEEDNPILLFYHLKK